MAAAPVELLVHIEPNSAAEVELDVIGAVGRFNPHRRDSSARARTVATARC
ncbi:hypothetical protein AB0911_37335 [Streptomyces nigra]|uniref:hypothetical protein n=1 Tax=Streptomyces nigra TaxID=1827580 RepID=UPI0034554482